jgi:preprotein translocase subunit SecF
MKLIPDDINLDFMGARKKAFVLSGIFVLSSLLIVIVMGLNKGIDFKGGSSVIVEFKDGELSDTASLEASVAKLVNAELGSEATQVSVQTFDSGVQSQTEAGVPINRYIIYTEATSLISGEKKQTIAEELEAIFKAGDKKAKAKFTKEGSDVYYLSLPEKQKIKEVEGKIRALLSRDCAKGEAGAFCY